MEWLDRSLADLYRLLVALDAAGGDEFVQGLINRVPLPDGFKHPRITVRSLLQLLAQTNGSTVLPEEVVAFLRVLTGAVVPPPPPAGTPAPAAPPEVDQRGAAFIIPLGEVVVDRYALDFLATLPQRTAIGWIHNKISTTNFPELGLGAINPLQPEFQPELAFTPGQRRTTLSAIAFSRRVSSGFALLAMIEKGFRPATLRELLALLERLPELPRQYSLAVLGSYFEEAGQNGRRYPFVNRFGPDGCIQLSLGKNGETTLSWGGDYCFLMAARN